MTCGIIRPELTPGSSARKARQAAHLGVDQHGGAALRDRADFAQGHGDDVGGEGDRLGVEIAAGDGRVLVREDDRIVGDGAGLDGQRARGVGEQVERGAHHLRLAAEAVGVLDLAAAAVAGEDFAAVEQARRLRRRRGSGRAGRAAPRCAGRTAWRCPSAHRPTGRRRRWRRRTRARRRTRRRARWRSRPGCR